MTFVLNILHKDFSLLVGDRKARTDGPATLTVAQTVIHVKGRITDNSFQKIRLNLSKSLALGTAGSVSDHAYVRALEQTDDSNEALALIHSHMNNFLSIERAIPQGSYRQNGAIATFFHASQKIYFSNLNFFTSFSNSTHFYTRSADDASLIMIGSGADVLEKAVGKNELHQFRSSVRSINQIDDYLGWLKDAYEKVSKLDENSGDKFDAVLSTRDAPLFRSTGDAMGKGDASAC